MADPSGPAGSRGLAAVRSGGPKAPSVALGGIVESELVPATRFESKRNFGNPKGTELRWRYVRDRPADG